MKKILALILTLSLMLSALPPAFASGNEAVQAAEALNALGLFNGTGTDAAGNPIYDLDRSSTRQEAVVMLVRLLGKEGDAQAGTLTVTEPTFGTVTTIPLLEIPFTDVAGWAVPYVRYAYTTGLSQGTDYDVFGANDPINATQFLTFVLRALGYNSGADFQWDRSWELSDKIGLTQGQFDGSSAHFTRGDMAVISHQALFCQMKDSSQTLLELVQPPEPEAPPEEEPVEASATLKTMSFETVEIDGVTYGMTYTPDGVRSYPLFQYIDCIWMDDELFFPAHIIRTRSGPSDSDRTWLLEGLACFATGDYTVIPSDNSHALPSAAVRMESQRWEDTGGYPTQFVNSPFHVTYTMRYVTAESELVQWNYSHQGRSLACPTKDTFGAFEQDGVRMFGISPPTDTFKKELVTQDRGTGAIYFVNVNDFLAYMGIDKTITAVDKALVIEDR